MDDATRTMAGRTRDAQLAWRVTLCGLALGAGLLLVAQPGTAQATGGPDGGGYSWVDNTAAGTPVPWAFVDILGNGTVVTGVGDDTQTLLPLPFAFRWYDIWTPQVKLSSNGMLCMDASVTCTSLSPSATPSSLSPNLFVAAYWKDLNCVTTGPVCQVRTATWGTAPDRVFVVQVANQRCFSTAANCNLTYQYKVFEQGYLEVHYGAMADVSSANAFTGTEGRSAPTTFTGLNYNFGPGSTAAPTLASKAIRYSTVASPPPPPPSCPTTGPANDCFDQPMVLTGNVVFHSQDTTSATAEFGEPNPGWTVGRTVWFSWTPTVSGNGLVTTCAVPPNPAASFDTVLGVYTAQSLMQWTLVGGNDQSCGNQSLVSFACTAGTTYRIQVASFSSLGGGTLNLQASCAPPCTTPANDCFSTATVLSGNSHAVLQSTLGATSGLAPDTGEPSASMSKTVWFRWTPTVSGTAFVTTCAYGANPAADFDTVIAVYTGSAVNSLSSLANNDQACGSQSTVQFSCVAGTTYHIQAGSWGTSAAGNLAIAMACAPPCTLPANDCFSSATVLPTDTAAVAQPTFGAATEAGEPTTVAAPFSTTISKSVWFRWTPTVSGNAVVSTCALAPNPAASYDTVVAVWTGSAVNALSLVGANDNSCGSQSSVAFSCVAGTTYRIQVSSRFATGQPGTLHLNASCIAPCTVPANDCFGLPTVVAGNAFATVQSTLGATMEAGEPNPGGLLASKSVWFRWTPTQSGTALATTCAFGANPASTFNTILAVYTGATLAALSPVVSNDNGCGSQQSIVRFPCVAGTTYNIQATSSGTTGAAGNLAMTLDCAPTCAPPVNDCFAAPTPVATWPTAFSSSVVTTYAAFEPGEPKPSCCSSAGSSVWYSFLAGPGTFNANTCNDPFPNPTSTTYDTVLAVYTGSALTALSQVAVNDDACSLQSSVTFTCVAGTLYRIQLTSFGNAVGTARLRASGCIPPDTDLDGRPDPFDNCPNAANPTQADLDGDALGDVCDPDADNDTVLNADDNCPLAANLAQANLDGDALGDACDPDADGDGAPNLVDNCPGLANGDQGDADLDAVGDACDPDADGDGLLNLADNCPVAPNAGQADLDLDRIGDACDPDMDGDNAPNGRDNCPLVFNWDQRDRDQDREGDTCDGPSDAVATRAVPPAARFVALPACGEEAVPFDASGSSDEDGLVVAWEWDFGDLSTGSGPNPAHTFPGPGRYDVALTVLDDSGASDTWRTSVTVGPCDAPVPALDAQRPAPREPPAPPVVDARPEPTQGAPDPTVDLEPDRTSVAEGSGVVASRGEARDAPGASSAQAPNVVAWSIAAVGGALLVAFGAGALFMRGRR